MLFIDRRYELIAIIGILLLISYLVLLTVYNNEGIGWDFADNYLNAQTILNGHFYRMLPLNISAIGIAQNGSDISNINYQFIAQNGIYIVLARPPIAPLLIAFATLIDSNASIQIYILMLLILMAASMVFVSERMAMNPLILSGLMFSFFVIRWTVLYNSEELLSISAAFLFIGMLVGKTKLTGIPLAIAGLAKYTNLALLPMILLLGNVRKIAMALLIFVLFTLPFVAAQFLIFGYSLISYQISLHEVSLNSSTTGFFGMLSGILIYPAVILVLAIFFGLLKNREKLLTALDPRRDYRYAVAFSFLAISMIGYLMEYQHVGVPMRFGYLPYASLALLTALVISSIGDTKVHPFKGKDLNFVAQFGVFFVSLCILTLLYLQVSSGNYGLWLGQERTKNPDISQALQVLHKYNLSDCAIVSNVWPFMNFYNVTAYSSDATCNATEQRFPYLIFSTFGPKEYCAYGIQFNNNTGNSENFSVVTPANYICMKN